MICFKTTEWHSQLILAAPVIFMQNTNSNIGFKTIIVFLKYELFSTVAFY